MAEDLMGDILPPGLGGDSDLAQWAWDRLSEGRSLAWIEANMVDQPAFKERFPAIVDMRNEGRVPITPEQYVRFEQDLAQVASQIDLPDGATSSSSVHQLLMNNVSTQELRRLPQIRSQLREMDLEENLGDWTWEQLTEGRGADQIMLEMEDTEAFRERFPAIHQLREQGENAPSPEEYMQFEDDVGSLAARFNLPDEFASRDRVGQLMLNQVRAPELEQRLTSLSSQVLAQGDDIRSWYAENHNVTGLSDGALLASAMTPGISPADFESRIRAAQVGGAAREAGFDRGRRRARELAQRGVGLDQARELFTNASQQLPDFQALVRRHHDPDDEFSLRDFEDAMVFGDPDARSRMERLMAQEQASFSQGATFRRDEQGGLTGLRQR